MEKLHNISYNAFNITGRFARDIRKRSGIGLIMELHNVPWTVRKIRKALNLTQEQLAQRLGVSFVTVNGWENGKRRPSPLARAAVRQLMKDAGIEST